MSILRKFLFINSYKRQKSQQIICIGFLGQESVSCLLLSILTTAINCAMTNYFTTTTQYREEVLNSLSRYAMINSVIA